MRPLHDRCELEPILQCDKKGNCLEFVLEEDIWAGKWISSLEDGWTVEHSIELPIIPFTEQ